MHIFVFIVKVAFGAGLSLLFLLGLLLARGDSDLGNNPLLGNLFSLASLVLAFLLSLADQHFGRRGLRWFYLALTIFACVYSLGTWAEYKLSPGASDPQLQMHATSLGYMAAICLVAHEVILRNTRFASRRDTPQ